MKEPMISIVIPAYQIAPFISATLDSVFAQTYQNLEVIAVDDGSLDETGDLLDQYAAHEPRLTVIHKKNEGVTIARLTGVQASRGEYIGFVDGDDRIDSDMFERLVQNAQRYQADISHCGYRVVKENQIVAYYGTGVFMQQDHRQGLRDLLEGNPVEPSLCNKLFKHSLFEPLLQGRTIMDLSLRENEDLLMNYCLFSAATFSVFEDVCPYQYLVRGDSSSHGSPKPHIFRDPVRIGRMLIKDTASDPELYRYAFRYYMTKLIKAATISDSSSQDLLSVRSSARTELRKALPTYLALGEEPKKKRLLAFLAAVCPFFYGRIHQLYQRL